MFTEGTNKPKSMVSTLISGMFLDSESSRKLTDLVELTNSVSTRPHTDKAVLIVGQLTVDGFVEKHPGFTLNQTQIWNRIGRPTAL